VEYETKVFLDSLGQKSEYQGTPTDEMDALWDDLYGRTYCKPLNISFCLKGPSLDGAFTMLDKQSADQLPNKTVEIPGTGKYIVSLELFHQLHCLVSILREY